MTLAMSKLFIKRKLAELKENLEAENNDLSKLIRRTGKYLDAVKNATLDIAITGASGAGKSSLVNALRGINDDDKDAADIGVTETTMEPKKYPHPKFPNVKIWDLPGIGTPKFKPEIYLQTVQYQKYDFFIIVAAERFTQYDVFLAQAIHKMNKKFYYVRNKIDQAIDSEKRKRDFNKEKSLEKIRNYCCNNLTEAGESNPRVFLISVWDLKEYDFLLLVNVLENDLHEFKRHAFIRMLSNFSKEIRKKKKAAMEDLIWKVAFMSSFTGNETFPGLRISCNTFCLEASMRDFSKSFDLDEDSLSRLANKVGKPVSVLHSAIRKTVITDKIDTEFIHRRLLEVKQDEEIEELGRMILDYIPVVGTVYRKTNTISVLSHTLQIFLDEVQEGAENVWETAFEISEPQTQKTSLANICTKPLIGTEKIRNQK